MKKDPRLSKIVLVVGSLLVVLMMFLIISTASSRKNKELTAEREAYKATSRESVSEKEQSIKDGRLEAINKLEETFKKDYYEKIKDNMVKGIYENGDTGVMSYKSKSGKNFKYRVSVYGYDKKDYETDLIIDTGLTEPSRAIGMVIQIGVDNEPETISIRLNHGINHDVVNTYENYFHSQEVYPKDNIYDRDIGIETYEEVFKEVITRVANNDI